jgi:SM-20-related protein
MNWLESLLDPLAEHGFCFSDQAISQVDRKTWFEVLKNHQTRGHFHPAAIGRDTWQSLNAQVRNDQISWLDSGHSHDQLILNTLNSWRQFLNQNLFLSMRATEAHFAHYEPGHFYQRHKDQHDSSQSRIMTFVVYLHDSWKKGDGGELVITDGDQDKIIKIVEPLPGRVVIFRSDEIWHQVQKSDFHRYSLTGWFRHDSKHF